jgi:hypothetical protein
MGKIIKLTESDLTKIVRTVINETKFEKQSDIDAILDKINKYGMDSLTWTEKELLQSPEDSSHEFEGSDEVHEAISILTKNKLIDPDVVNVDEDGFQLYSIPGHQFCFFDSYDFIEFKVYKNKKGELYLSVVPDIFPNEEQDESDCRWELYSFLQDTWPEYGIEIDLDDVIGEEDL